MKARPNFHAAKRPRGGLRHRQRMTHQSTFRTVCGHIQPSTHLHLPPVTKYPAQGLQEALYSKCDRYPPSHIPRRSRGPPRVQVDFTLPIVLTVFSRCYGSKKSNWNRNSVKEYVAILLSTYFLGSSDSSMPQTGAVRLESGRSL